MSFQLQLSSRAPRSLDLLLWTSLWSNDWVSTSSYGLPLDDITCAFCGKASLIWLDANVLSRWTSSVIISYISANDRSGRKNPSLHIFDSHPCMQSIIIRYQKGVEGHCETIALNVSKITFNTTRSKWRPIWSTITTVPNFPRFPTTTTYCRVTHHLETSTPNDPKMALKTKSSKALHIEIAATSEL